MPELPEAQQLAERFAGEILNAYIEDVIVHDPLIGENAARVRGQKIIDISRYGKAVYLQLSRDALIVLPSAHTRIYFSPQPLAIPDARITYRTSRSLLYLAEKSRAPRILYVNKDETPLPDIGVDPLTKRFNTAMFRRRLRTATSTIHDFLVKENIIAGIGSRYAKAILVQTELDPVAAANSLPRGKTKQLFWNIKRVLREAMNEQCAFTEQTAGIGEE
ncbi:MAG: DNA-formamidopyrimidine glycosylase family protein [Spirochaetota bacterium]